MSDNQHSFSELFRKDEERLVHEMLLSFSTRNSLQENITRQITLIGIFFKTWLKAKEGLHFFANPSVGRIDWLNIVSYPAKTEYQTKDLDKGSKDIFEKTLKHIDGNTHSGKRLFSLTTGDRSLVTLLELPEQSGESENYFLFHFSKKNTPFGYFIFLIGTKDEEANLKLSGILNTLEERLKDLLYGRYIITHQTYLPSFQIADTIRAAVLYCDIRNSTSAFEITRMADDEHRDMLIVLLKAFFKYASRIIATTGVGKIHRLVGDGLVATFGEYLPLNHTDRASTACALASISAKYLLCGFDDLWKNVKNHEIYKDFIVNYNEDFDLRLGIGLNYGDLYFDNFGIMLEEDDSSQHTKGHYSEYTAVGEYISLAQRLCSVAHQPISSVEHLYRSEKFEEDRLTAAIIASRTFTHWLNEVIQSDLLSKCRIDLVLKGKGHPIPGFELSKFGGEIKELKYIKYKTDDMFHTHLTEDKMGEKLDAAITWLIEELDKLNQKRINRRQHGRKRED